MLAAGQPADAHARYADALTGAARNGELDEQARAHHGLARTSHTTGDPGQARHHWTEALTLYTTLGAPEADQIRAHLASAP